MKLKTLKDLIFELGNLPTSKRSKNYYTESLGDPAKFIDPKELKAEAVKWVKIFNGLGVGIFMEFFNLTEEDLEDD